MILWNSRNQTIEIQDNMKKSNLQTESEDLREISSKDVNSIKPNIVENMKESSFLK